MTADLYSPCPNCKAAWSPPSPRGTDGTESMRTRSHVAGCPGDGPVVPPAALPVGLVPFGGLGLLRAGRVDGDEEWRPYGVKTNGVQP